MKTITEQMQKITEDICDNYCKYPLLEKYKGDEGQQNMFDEICEKCPLNQFYV